VPPLPWQVDAKDTLLSQGFEAADELEHSYMEEDGVTLASSGGHTGFVLPPGQKARRGPPRSDVRGPHCSLSSAVVLG
jgi:hypothetical protein